MLFYQVNHRAITSEIDDMWNSDSGIVSWKFAPGKNTKHAIKVTDKNHQYFVHPNHKIVLFIDIYCTDLYGVAQTFLVIQTPFGIMLGWVRSTAVVTLPCREWVTSCRAKVVSACTAFKFLATFSCKSIKQCELIREQNLKVCNWHGPLLYNQNLQEVGKLQCMCSIVTSNMSHMSHS